VRVDLTRLKEVLGPDPEKLLTEELRADALAIDALAKGRSATLGLRSADIDTGDHVLIVEGDMKSFVIDERRFSPLPSANDKVKVFTKITPTSRRGTEVVVVLDERAVVFASPAEADAVLRVVRDGADDDRGKPAAEGLMSFDMRPRRLPTIVQRRAPSVAHLLSQVQRIRGMVSVESESLLVRLEVIGKSEGAVERLGRFLSAFRDEADPSGASALLKTLKLEPLGATLAIRLEIPAIMVVAALKSR
jgi:hypothetical protein